MDLRVALIGYGLAGESFHAPLIAATRDMSVSAIVTSNAERAGNARRAYPDARIFEGTEQLWEHARDYDVVVVATPNRTHAPLAMQAMEAGLAVVVDKPFVVNAEQGRELISEASSRKLILTVFQNRRWDGDFLTVQKLLRAGSLGDVARFESRFERFRPVAKTGWRQETDPVAGGGVLYDLGSHLIDQAIVLFGPVHSVYAELDRRAQGSEVDDDAFVALSHKSGVRSHLWMNTVAAQSGPRMRILGNTAAFTKYGLDVQEAALRTGGRPGDSDWGREPAEMWGRLGSDDDSTVIETEPGNHRAFYEGVAEALRTGAAPPVDPNDAVAAIEIIEAARMSAAEKRVIRV